MWFALENGLAGVCLDAGFEIGRQCLGTLIAA